MTSPFDNKNRVAAALDRLALRVLLFVLSVGYFFFLWHSGALSLLAGSALFILAMLTLLLLERRTLARRDHALRVRVGGSIALEELMLLPAAQAEKRVCALLAQTLGGNARDSVLTYANKTYLVRCAANPVRLFRRRGRCAGRAPRPDCLGNGILHSSLNRRLFPIRSACRRVDGTAGSPDCRPSTGAAFRPAAPRYPTRKSPAVRVGSEQPFSRGRIRALALAPAKQGRYLLVAFLLTMLYLLLHSALSLVFCAGFVCAGNALRTGKSKGVSIMIIRRKSAAFRR